VAKGRFPSWAVVRPVLGIALALLLVTLVVGRATGLIGDAAGGDPTTATGGAPETTSPGLPSSSSPSPGTGESVDPGDPGDSGDSGVPEQGAESGTKTRADAGTGDEPRERKRKRERQRDPASWVGGDTADPELVKRVEELLEAGRTEAPARFRVASLNVLGASHTAGGGNKPSYASGATRIGWVAQLLHQLDVDVVGLQEYEPVQHQAFLRSTGDRYGVYPGLALGRGPIRNSIVWKRATWDAVSTSSNRLPYFRGKRVPMPYVLLEHRESGRRVWFVNIHNPVSSPKRGDNERWRDLATSLEIGLVQRLSAETGHPVILMGDFNEREEAFCAVTRRAPAVAANGGTAGPPCVPPATIGIDWIFGTTDIAFSDYRRLRGGLIARATDHPVIVADAELPDSPS
jgi:endonuclease/exonuclease/phosphatase family metal-dependent hydrolase